MPHQPLEIDHALTGFLAMALKEDIGTGDITSNWTLREDEHCRFSLIARENMVVAGIELVPLIFTMVSEKMRLPAPELELCVLDSKRITPGTVLINGTGAARIVMAAERLSLNILQHLSGIATLTQSFVDQVQGLDVTILDTRKTTPGLRTLEKYAVTCGGGQNHRFGLYDGILIKDNHIAICGSIREAIKRAIAHRDATEHDYEIEIECETLSQVKEALAAGANRILLDNMSVAEIKNVVQWVDGQVPLEASGNINHNTIRAIAETGVTHISIGRITHSAPSVDIGLDMAL